MSDMTKLAAIILGGLIVVGGIFLVIYLTQGGEGDSTDIPGNPSEIVMPLLPAGH